MELELEPEPGPLEPPEVEPGVELEVELDVEPEPETEPPALSLDVLPDELLLRVLAALSVADVGTWRSVSLVASRWRRVALHPELSLWSELNSQRFCAMWGHHADAGGIGITCDAPAFEARHLLPIAARCTHLVKVDLTGIGIGGMLAGSSMPEMVQLVRGREHLDSFRARGGAPTDLRLLRELAQLPALTSLSLAETDVAESTLLSLAKQPGGCFASLQRLSVAHCARLDGSGLVHLVQALPSLRALSVDGCAQLRASAVEKLSRINVDRPPAAHISISAILQAAKHGAQKADARAPGPLDVSCGICHRVLWRDLRDYCLHDGQQPHIQSELTTNTPPMQESVARYPESADEVNLLADDPERHARRRWHCRDGCHGDQMWLLDNRSGFIETHGADWAIACGPATSFAGRPHRPALGTYTPSAAAAALQLEWVDFTPVEARDEAALLGLDIEDLHLGRYTDVLP